MGIVRFTLLFVLGVASAHVAAAQETINYASVSGRVTDPQGAEFAVRLRFQESL